MLADWRTWLLKSLDKTRDLPESRYFQLATVDENGCPQNRTVVCRGFDDAEALLWVVTDSRNCKVPELKLNPQASICWYFSKTREQYRLAVTARVETPDSALSLCQHHWQRLSVSARQQFLWGEPGTKRAHPKRSLVDHSADTEVVPPHFCVLALTVTSVDYLNLRGNPQTRYYFTQHDGDWHAEALIP
ncbi:pyridoxamine 5'-phosphate oxidase family protein [Alteromonas lipolytica]|uniref:Pyridoxamine 5'-phosphate oxidase Alr4036 family FMN-binding domain-containing protein n=1 Tax=Alteromonas lipolytica TaxID=1856405 RepID=A0A1E8FJM4_9ALTE|nr:pyridoxamine 5'-phosphate oxidase family protein [Alteromonas lipolytica]OFI35818.1 hypothetical protein BFC17_11090 [Alteromonas lipolytica]GGF81080.1 hypothetical protein GCM10011338_36630 [Alteromonas lipolytica]